VAAAAIASGPLDFLQDRGRRRKLQARAAKFLRDQYREVAGLRQRVDKGARIGHLAVELAPVFTGKLGAELGDGVADVGMVVLLLVSGVVLCGHRNSAGRSRGRAGVSRLARTLVSRAKPLGVGAKRRPAQSMIRKSMPSGRDPMGGCRFSEKIMLKQ
jgi:hypothetical protein